MSAEVVKIPEKQREVDGSAPAVMIRCARNVGNQAMEMNFAVPLDMKPADLNAYVDKVTAVMERQGDKAALEQEEIALKNAERDLATGLMQLSNQRAADELRWVSGGRKGEFKPTESQQAQYGNWDKNTRHLRDERIPQIKARIAELRARINAGV